MASLIRILLFTGLLLVALFVIACYALSEVRRLSLPISQIFALFAILLPLTTGLSLEYARRKLRIHASNLGRTWPTLYFILVLVLQLIYETVIGTLALTYMAPPSSLHCGLEEKWKRLFMSKDETAIKRIQNTFDCCGFNALADRAWPFPSKDIDARECQRRFDRTQSCAGPWRQAEQINAGLFLIVAAVIFLGKLLLLTSIFATPTTSIPWFRSPSFKRVTAGEVEDGRRLIEEGEPEQVYRDEVESGNADNGEVVASSPNTNGNRPRIEPSGLLVPGEGWNNED